MGDSHINTHAHIYIFTKETCIGARARDREDLVKFQLVYVYKCIIAFYFISAHHTGLFHLSPPYSFQSHAQLLLLVFSFGLFFFFSWGEGLCEQFVCVFSFGVLPPLPAHYSNSHNFTQREKQKGSDSSRAPLSSMFNCIQLS